MSEKNILILLYFLANVGVVAIVVTDWRFYIECFEVRTKRKFILMLLLFFCGLFLAAPLFILIGIYYALLTSFVVIKMLIAYYRTLK